MHDAYIGGRSENNIKCALHDDLDNFDSVSGLLFGRTEQLDIFSHVTGFTSDFLSFIVVEHIQFFHVALQLYKQKSNNQHSKELQYTLHYICNQPCAQHSQNYH